MLKCCNESKTLSSWEYSIIHLLGAALSQGILKLKELANRKTPIYVSKNWKRKEPSFLMEWRKQINQRSNLMHTFQLSSYVNTIRIISTIFYKMMKNIVKIFHYEYINYLTMLEKTGQSLCVNISQLAVL